MGSVWAGSHDGDVSIGLKAIPSADEDLWYILQPSNNNIIPTSTSTSATTNIKSRTPTPGGISDFTVY
jgi:hypothetical protein